MGIVLELYELKNLCKDMAELGAANYAKMVFPAKDLISQREAYKSFGEARVKRWVRQQLVHPTRNGAEKRSKILYSRAELLTIEKTEIIKNKKAGIDSQRKYQNQNKLQKNQTRHLNRKR